MADVVAETLAAQDVRDGFHRIRQEVLEQIHPVITSAKQVGIELLNKNIDKIATLCQFLPDGKINVADYLNNPVAQSVLGPENAKFLSNFKSIEKHGDHITFTAKEDTYYPLNQPIPGTHGMLKTKDIHFDSTFSFDVKPDANGHTQISNIQGIHVEVEAPIVGTIPSKVNEIDIDHDRSGKPQATVKAEVPVTHKVVTQRVPFIINPDGTVKVG